MLSSAKQLHVNKKCCILCSTLILYYFVGTSTDLQCDQCQKTYCNKSSLNYHKKTQHKPVLLLWKMDGKHVDIQHPSNLKTESVDLELDMKKQTIHHVLNLVAMVRTEKPDTKLNWKKMVGPARDQQVIPNLAL